LSFRQGLAKLKGLLDLGKSLVLSMVLNFLAQKNEFPKFSAEFVRVLLLGKTLIRIEKTEITRNVSHIFLSFQSIMKFC